MKKYQIVAKKIEEYIKKNHLKQDDKLPKITDLVADFKVSKATILQALALLNQQGIIYKIQGSGIFVRMPQAGDKMNEYIPLNTNIGFSEVIHDLQNEVVEFKEMTFPDKIQKLFKTTDAKGYKVVRVRRNGKKTFVLEESYYRKEQVPFMSLEIVRGSIFNYLREALDLQIRFSDKYMTVKKLTAEEAKLLELEPGDPALQVYDVFYCNTGEAFDVSKLIYNYKNAKLFTESSDELI